MEVDTEEEGMDQCNSQLYHTPLEEDWNADGTRCTLAAA